MLRRHQDSALTRTIPQLWIFLNLVPSDQVETHLLHFVSNLSR